MTATLTFSEVTCRHPNCGGELEQVNAGATDGAVANWVGSCRRETSVKRPTHASTCTFAPVGPCPVADMWDGDMKRIINQPGDRFGSLTFVQEVGPSIGSTGRRHHMAEFRCDCGTTGYVNRLDHWRSGRVGSCGCHRPASRTHGLSGEPWYESWAAMIRRCKEHPSYASVEVCERWTDIHLFAEDMAASHFAGAHLARVADKGDYEPGNARWLTPEQNSREMVEHSASVARTTDGRIAMRVAVSNGIKPSTFRQRLVRGWSPDAASSVPPIPFGQTAAKLQWCVSASMTQVISRGQR